MMSAELYHDFVKWFTDNTDKFIDFKMTKEISKENDSEISYVITAKLPREE